MDRPATVDDVHALASGMPGARRYADRDPAVYQVSGRSFVFFRTPRPDAVDPDTGERYDDVIVFWVGSEEEKLALVLDEATPFFTTPHFDGHPSVLLRGCHVGRLSREELAEVVYDAWLARASRTAARKWLAERGLDGVSHRAPAAPAGPGTRPAAPPASAARPRPASR